MTDPAADTVASACSTCASAENDGAPSEARGDGSLEAMAGAWRSEAVLIMRPDAQLPDACLRCGQAASGYRLRKWFGWHAPLLYLLAIHLPIYVVVALVVRKRARVSLPLCRRHRRLRQLGLTVAWTLIPAGVGACVWGLAVDSMLLGTLGLYVALATCVIARLASRLVGVVRIDDHFVRLRGADLSLLDLLPDWDAFEEPRA
jgi:hypothetical protein